MQKQTVSIFEKLDSTQDSIVGASSLFMQSCQKSQSFCPKLIEIWKQRLATVSTDQQVSYIYLANDLIQRSKIKNQKPEFWTFFQEHLYEALTTLFSPKSCKLDTQQKIDILKVVDVWRQREVYPVEFAESIYNKLVEQSGIDVSFLHNQKSKKIKTSNLKCLAEKTDKKKQNKGQTILEVCCPQWVNLSEKLAQSFENRSKLQQLDKRLEELLAKPEKGNADLDETEINCKL